jgi:hypothetical protein
VAEPHAFAIGIGAMVAWGSACCSPPHRLDGQSASVLPSGMTMKTRETYAGGQLYIAIALVGRSPFIPKDT